MHNANSRKNHEMQTKAFPQFGGSVIAIAAFDDEEEHKSNEEG